VRPKKPTPPIARRLSLHRSMVSPSMETVKSLPLTFVRMVIADLGLPTWRTGVVTLNPGASSITEDRVKVRPCGEIEIVARW